MYFPAWGVELDMGKRGFPSGITSIAPRMSSTDNNWKKRIY
jgi:hypothetical protein